MTKGRAVVARSRGERTETVGEPQTHLRDERWLLFSNYSPWKHRPPLCHLDRSVAQWRDLRFSGAFLEMFFDRAMRSGATCGFFPAAQPENCDVTDR
jgi:hypothetical protein